MSAHSLALQEPVLAWSQLAAAEKADGLAWADASLDPAGQPLSARQPARNVVIYQAGPVTAVIPPSVAHEAWGAQSAGEATAWEGLQLLFARPRWVVASRGLLWSPASAEPRVLASLVEACGVDRGVHQNDRARLRRLSALMPSWRPYRGTVERAGEALEAAGLGQQTLGVVKAQAPSDDDEATAPSATAGEVFACHSASWWACRRVEESRPALRVQSGLVRFQPRAGAAFAVRKEDVLAEADLSRPLPRDLYRLLPVWTTVRPVSSQSKNARSS